MPTRSTLNIPLRADLVRRDHLAAFLVSPAVLEAYMETLLDADDEATRSGALCLPAETRADVKEWLAWVAAQVRG